MENGFNEIDKAFAGIYQNLSQGALGLIFKGIGFYSKLNSFGSVIEDADLHKIATLLSSNTAVRARVCNNVYIGGRIKELLEANQAMLGAQQAISQLKHSGEQTLDDNEKALIKQARKLQSEVVAVDSYNHEEYFRC